MRRPQNKQYKNPKIVARRLGIDTHPKSPRQPTDAEWQRAVNTVQKMPSDIISGLKGGEMRLHLWAGDVNSKKLTRLYKRKYGTPTTPGGGVGGFAGSKNATAQPDWAIGHELAHLQDAQSSQERPSRRNDNGSRDNPMNQDTPPSSEQLYDVNVAIGRKRVPAMKYGEQPVVRAWNDRKAMKQEWMRNPAEIYADAFEAYFTTDRSVLPAAVRKFFRDRYGE